MEKKEPEKDQGNFVRGVEKVSYGFDIFIVLSLLVLGLFLIYWAVYEVFAVFVGIIALQEGVLSMLGVLLILYAVSELIKEEIIRMKGGAFSIKVFVGLALAAVIRKVLLTSLTPEKTQELFVLSVLLVSLAVVYWAIHKVEGGA